MSDSHAAHENKVVCGVIAYFNEAENLEALVTALFGVFSRRPEHLRLVLVDDGSNDGSFAVATRLRETFPSIALIRFSRNFGHHSALVAGIKHAEGDLYFLMDADFQDDPESVPILIDALSPDVELVYAIRQERVEKWGRRVGADLYWWLVNKATYYYCEPHQAVLRVFTPPVRDAIAQADDYFPFLAGLFAWTGYDYKTVEVPHCRRRAGESKYSAVKIVSSVITSLLSFSQKPIRMLAIFGFAVSSVAFLVGLTMIFAALAFGDFYPGWTSTFVVVIFSLGIQLFAVGFVGEYVGRIFHQTAGRPRLIIREVHDWQTDE